MHFATVDENFTAYGLLTHRHTPEIEQAIGAQVLFTPHLAPMTRGILATCYARPTAACTTADVLGVLATAYADEPVRGGVASDSPSTKATSAPTPPTSRPGSTSGPGGCSSLCALDNLGKGASGQAVQCANLVLGLATRRPGSADASGVYP